MQAINATLGNFPAAFRCSYFCLNTGLHWIDDIIAMNMIVRIRGLPPRMLRLPFIRPLSLLNGVNPTKAAISRLFKLPSSGNSHNNVYARIFPTPGTLVRISVFIRHSWFSLMSCSIFSDKLSNCLSSIFSIDLIELCSSLGMICRRFFSIVLISTNWARRTSRSLINLDCLSGMALLSGFIVAANLASKFASILSVLAWMPKACANRLTLIGLAIQMGNFA